MTTPPPQTKPTSEDLPLPGPLPSTAPPTIDDSLPFPKPTAPSLPPPRRVSYISSPALHHLSSLLPSNLGRSQQVHDLISASGVLRISETDDDESKALSASAPSDCQSRRCRIVPPSRVGKRDLLRFHDSDYVGLFTLPLSLSPRVALLRSLSVKLT
jgi:hypothetical protein